MNCEAPLTGLGRSWAMHPAQAMAGHATDVLGVQDHEAQELCSW